MHEIGCVLDGIRQSAGTLLVCGIGGWVFMVVDCFRGESWGGESTFWCVVFRFV